MPQSNDLSRCLIPLRQDETLVAVVEMSKTSWLVAGMIPGVARHPLKKLVPDEKALFELLERWRDEAVKAGKIITRITVAYEAGRDGFWLARWLRARGFEVYVVRSSSVAVTREHRRANTDRLDCEMLKRVFIGWLRGERDHCRMVAIATQTQEDAKRANRERENLVGECTRIVGRLKAGWPVSASGASIQNCAMRRSVSSRCVRRRTCRCQRTRFASCAATWRAFGSSRTRSNRSSEPACVSWNRRPSKAPNKCVSWPVCSASESRAVARYAGLTGSPDESGQKRREKGLSRAGNARVRRGMIQLAWRSLMFQRTSALAQWYRVRTKDAGGAARKTLIVALARKLLISLWRFVTTGEVPVGVTLRVA